MPMSECVEWTGAKYPDGYGRVWVRELRRQVKAHRAVVAVEVGWDALRGRNVNHRCDNRLCVNRDHLYVGTQRENVDDMIERGRRASTVGSSNGRARLTVGDVLAIRAAAGELQEKLARQYGVSSKTINHILKRRTWRHV